MRDRSSLSVGDIKSVIQNFVDKMKEQSREDKESMFLTYSELLNSLDSGAVTKITINNRRLNKANFETCLLYTSRCV